MGHPMIIEIGARGESLPTHLTLMWFLSTMNSPMCVEGTGGGKPFTAD